MNWFIEIVNLPDEGSYAYDAGENTYRWLGESIDIPSADLSLLPGQGFGMWTKYQDGYFGFFRPERAGVFYDKFYALRALAIRDWGLSFTIDERYFINFYDLFQTEMTEFFGGLILQDESWFAPRLAMDSGEPVVQHMSWYRGLALGECIEDGARVPCRGSQREVYPGPAIEGTTNEVLRSWAAILALAQFPVYYDTSFEQRLLVFKAGSGSGFDIPDIQSDGSPTCVYGTDGLGAGHFVVDPNIPNDCDTPEDADYVVFESNRFRTPYVAVKIRTEPRTESRGRAGRLPVAQAPRRPAKRSRSARSDGSCTRWQAAGVAAWRIVPRVPDRASDRVQHQQLLLMPGPRGYTRIPGWGLRW